MTLLQITFPKPGYMALRLVNAPGKIAALGVIPSPVNPETPDNDNRKERSLRLV